MGRIVDLLGEVAAAAEEGPEGLVLVAEDRERFASGEWRDEDLDDALALVNDSLLQGELVDAADSLSSRLVDLLGAFGGEASFAKAAADEAQLSFEAIGQLARRIARLEEVLELFRDSAPPDRHGFDALRARLADFGIESQMRGDGPNGSDQGD
jgi:hypothetical protein